MQTLPIGVTFFERGWLSSNNVLIQDFEQSILVDTGYWRHADQTRALVASTLGERELTAIFNTHLHSDHCGGNALLEATYKGLRTYIPPGHADFVEIWDPDALTYTATGQYCPQFVHTDILHDKDVFVIAGKTWRSHAAPGHDPHSVVIFNETDGVLISADALWENGFGVVFPELEGFSAFDEVESTLDIIADLAPKLVLPGHGAAFTDVSGALSRARSRLEQFRRSPHKHASYAAKVLLKFKLLEFQDVSKYDFIAWAESVRYLQLLHISYSDGQSYGSWILELCNSLEKSGACLIKDQSIININ
jgi:glyoxylase-like metal-dependent hydrolase (beta-lactamase superfamily II)